MKRIITLIIVGWFMTLLKHVTLLPCVDWEEHEITGFEIKLKF